MSGVLILFIYSIYNWGAGSVLVLDLGGGTIQVFIS